MMSGTGLFVVRFGQNGSFVYFGGLMSTPTSAADINVNWILDNHPGETGLLTSKINSLLESLRNELTALGGRCPRSELDELSTPWHLLTNDPLTFPEKMVEWILQTPKEYGLSLNPVWRMMTQHVRARIGNPPGVLPDPSTEYNDTHAAMEVLDSFTPSFRPLIGELLDRSHELMSHYVRQCHGRYLTLFRTLVIEPGPTAETQFSHAPLSSWTDNKEFARGWKKGPRREMLTALVPAECVWIAPGCGERELVLSPQSPDGQAIEVTEVTVLPAAIVRGQIVRDQDIWTKLKDRFFQMFS